MKKWKKRKKRKEKKRKERKMTNLASKKEAEWISSTLSLSRSHSFSLSHSLSRSHSFSYSHSAYFWVWWCFCLFARKLICSLMHGSWNLWKSPNDIVVQTSNKNWKKKKSLSWKLGLVCPSVGHALGESEEPLGAGRERRSRFLGSGHTNEQLKKLEN
jgi:hypothetical protein